MRDLDSILCAELDRIAPAEPDPERQWERVLAMAQDRPPQSQSARVHRPLRTPARQARPMSRRVIVLTCGFLVAVGAAAVLVLLSPWRSGPAALSPADAAVVLRHTAAVIARPGHWVLYTRERIGVSPESRPGTDAWSGVAESWVDNSGTQDFRNHTTFPNLPSAIDVGGSLRGSSPTYVFDPANNTLYYVQVYAQGSGYLDPISLIKRELQTGTAKLIARQTLNGRAVYRIVITELHATTTLFVDAHSYQPVRSERVLFLGNTPIALFPQKPRTPLSTAWRTTTDYLSYSYLPASKTNRALANIRAQHPHARIDVTPNMPPRFKQQHEPWTGS